jgi:hypothetical protein
VGTFVTSLAGVSFYQLIAPLYQTSGMTVVPNWPLGLSFGVGGMAGMYLGARAQRFIPATYLEMLHREIEQEDLYLIRRRIGALVCMLTTQDADWRKSSSWHVEWP